jgi:hypothetical protein
MFCIWSCVFIRIGVVSINDYPFHRLCMYVCMYVGYVCDKYTL